MRWMTWSRVGKPYGGNIMTSSCWVTGGKKQRRFEEEKRLAGGGGLEGERGLAGEGVGG